LLVVPVAGAIGVSNVQIVGEVCAKNFGSVSPVDNGMPLLPIVLQGGEPVRSAARSATILPFARTKVGGVRPTVVDLEVGAEETFLEPVGASKEAVEIFLAVAEAVSDVELAMEVPDQEIYKEKQVFPNGSPR